MIRITNLSLTYGRRGQNIEALRDINLSIQKGEFICLLGPSGCGKSSLLNLIGGFLNPTKGEIRINNLDMKRPNADIGMIFQKFSLFPWQTVAQNIAFGLRQKNLEREAVIGIVRSYLKKVDLIDFESAYPNELSGGMQQRVAIARSFANDPAILLMDEPFGSLDSQTKYQMRSLLLDIWNVSRKTVVFVTHDIEEAIELSDRIIVISSRPGTIKYELSVELPRPRNWDVLNSKEGLSVRELLLSLL
ncbi:ABC transporter ATP-binding protein [Dyadobacter frigoris]|uniref:ABC transporter ATP-binding protein n=1 Tax=Dyadobacter frigoris TaxID=2576211 RepID=A0A4U6D7F5_9BACT|nr:ABC transporter ATP-binding protein [Dyadobacter frigoris]TKT93322.1 ABC transporter ATP-binding protein [Dyadobacter frigoris]